MPTLASAEPRRMQPGLGSAIGSDRARKTSAGRHSTAYASIPHASHAVPPVRFTCPLPITGGCSCRALRPFERCGDIIRCRAPPAPEVSPCGVYPPPSALPAAAASLTVLSTSCRRAAATLHILTATTSRHQTGWPRCPL